MSTTASFSVPSVSAPAASRPGWLPASLFPFESRFLSLDGHRVHYVDEGSGPVLLMLHGNPTWSFSYRHLLSLLRDRFRCIALDYPGFGLSEAASDFDFLPEHQAEVVARFVDALGLSRYSLVAQDWGGPIGLSVAARHPERIDALVLGNTWAWPVDHEPHFTRFSEMMGGRLGGVAIRTLNAFVNVMIPMGTRLRRLSRDEMRCYRAPMGTAARREATHVFPRAIVGSTPWLRTVDASLASLADKPLLLCWATDDIAFREEERRGFEARFPCNRTVVLKGAGHFVQEDAPEAIADAVRSFFAETVAAR
ncbi:Haloalkane dehalogenase 2 [Minicystis rosea]|nr:Haloalkane dehalogenase 2 [Minicystis rosea]